MNMNYSQKPCKVDGFTLILCALRGYWEVFKPENVTVRFVFWKDNSGML